MRRRYLFVATVLLALTLSTIPQQSMAKKPKKAKIPTLKDIGRVALDTLLEDVPQKMVREYYESREAEQLAARNPQDPSLQNLAAVDVSGMTSCDQVVNELLLHITQFKSIFYFLVNGWYLGQLGDYASCRTFTNNGQYVLATIQGDYTADYPFTRGSYGKYIDFSTQMGLCVPKQCDIDDIKRTIEPLLIRYASEAHWENPTVSYQASWEYVNTESRAFDSTGKIVGVSIFGAMLLLIAIGSCVEISSIGNDPEFDKDVLNELNKFKSTAQYETVIMQQKLPWARYFVAISAIRNINKMNMQPYQMRKAQTSKNLDQTYLGNLSIFNGLKAISCFYVILASSFLFTWYAYLADPTQVVTYKESFAFLFVYCAYFTAPCLFLTAGFLQTFSFLQQDQDTMFSAKNLLKYYAWRLFKFVPLLGMVLVFSLFCLPFLGSGPIWKLYADVMAPCDTYWWTVLLQVNNIYPRTSFDDKCMPWAWFIPALTQLSLLLPIFVAIYQLFLPNRFVLRIFYSIFLFICCLGCGVLTFLYDEGAMPVSIHTVDTASGIVNSLTTLKFDFYNDVFMLPVFHLASYFGGFGLAIVYRRFLIDSELNKDVQEENPQISRASRFFYLLAENARVRYATYVFGSLLMIGSLAWCYPFMSNAENQPNWHATLFSIVAPHLFGIGISTYIMPALVGKAALFRSVMSCGMFLIVSNLAATMCLIGPQICLWYYLSSGHTLDISWYVTQYYFDSNAVFTFLISILVAALSDKPFYSLIHLEQDTKYAEEDIVNSIAQYKATSVWRSQGGSTLIEGQQRYVDVRDVQSLVGTNTNRQAASQLSDQQNYVVRGQGSRLLSTSDGPQEVPQQVADIRCHTLPTQVAPVQVGDPRKAGKKGIFSPNDTADSNRITALDDINRETMQRSTRAETQMFRETNANNSNH